MYSNPKMDMLNEKGLELLELKKALDTSNELVRKPLVESVNQMKMKKSLKEALLGSMGNNDFLHLLSKEKPYLDKTKLKSRYASYIQILERKLEQRNIPVQYDISFDRGVVIVKKYGATIGDAKRHFKMTEDEYQEALKSGFLETFLRNIALSMKRDMEEKMKWNQKWLKSSDMKKLKVKISDVYHDEETGYYNVDVKMKLTDYESLNSNHFADSISIEIERNLDFLQGSYFRRMNFK